MRRSSQLVLLWLLVLGINPLGVAPSGATVEYYKSHW